jgi:hypothetical protein
MCKSKNPKWLNDHEDKEFLSWLEQKNSEIELQLKCYYNSLMNSYESLYYKRNDSIKIETEISNNGIRSKTFTN